jgi:hypothetical protein
MKLPLIALLTIFSCCCHHAFSQTKDSIPDFGQIDKAELQMSECDFDKNAEALVLFDVEEVVGKVYPYSVYTETERHIRIKILKNKGLDEANIKIIYLRGQEGDRVNIVDAQTYNLDGSGKIVVTKLDKKTIVDKEINKKLSEKIFTFPDVRTGSVIEYTYKISGSISSGLRNWYFQKSIPVRFSRYTTDFPQSIELVCRSHCTLQVNEHNSIEGFNNIKVFTMTNVPALRDEPYMTCEDDYTQRVEPDLVAVTLNGHRTGLTESWGSIVYMLMSDVDFGQQLTKNIPRTDDLEDSLQPVTDSIKKMNIIYRYVRDNMHWNGRSNIWALDGVKSAWKNKKGTSGEINLILVNLLKDAGLEAYPVLVSSRNNGRINFSTPEWRQFNAVMALVVIKGHDYVLDATDRYNSSKLIPWEVNYSDGLVIEKFDTFKWGWKTLWDENDMFKDLVLIQGNIDDQGVMTGEATISSYDYSRVERMEDMKEGKDKFIEKYFSSRNATVHVDSTLIKNEGVDTLPLSQKVWFNEKLSSSGNYKYFSTNLFTGLEKNPFTADRRFSDIFFGANQNYTIAESFFIPDGYAFDELPKNIKMIMPDTSIVFTRLISAQNDLLNMRITLEFRKPVFAASEYEPFREFYKKLFGMLNEQIVIKKVN